MKKKTETKKSEKNSKQSNDKQLLVAVSVIFVIIAVVVIYMITRPKDEDNKDKNSNSPKPSEKMKLMSVPDDFCVTRGCVSSEIYNSKAPQVIKTGTNKLNQVLMRKVKIMGALEASDSGTPGEITVNSNFGLTDNHVKELINTAHSLTKVPKNMIVLDYQVKNKVGKMRILQLPEPILKFSGETKPVGPNVIISYGKQGALDCPVCTI